MGAEISRLLRLWEIIGDLNRDPPIEPKIPISRSAWLEGVRTGRYPKPVRLGPRTVAWRSQDIQALIDQN